MNDTEPPKIEFPCRYPIKVIGVSVEGFTELVVSIITRHDPGFKAESIELIDSRHGNYRSVRCWIEATGEAQLQALFEELKASGQIKMVL